MRPRHFLQLVLLSAFWGAAFPLIRLATPALGTSGIALLTGFNALRRRVR